jgi:hypothetical protein
MARRKQRQAPKYTPELASRILAEAEVEGDETVAKRHGCSVRTVQNYRARLKTDAELVETFRQKRAALTIPWRERAEQTLRLGLERLEQLMALAGVDQLRDVAGAVHIVASHAVTVDALGHGRHVQPASPSAADAAPAGEGRSAEPSSSADQPVH